MFEDSLVESKSTPISASRQWTTAGSIAVQSATAALIVILPLLHPELLPMHIEPPRVFTSVPPKPPIPIQPAPQSPSSTSSATLPEVRQQASTIPLTNGHGFRTADDPAPPLAPVGQGMGQSTGLPDALTAVGNGIKISAAPAPSNARPSISGGVAAGLLLTPIRPIYPAIARAAHIEGTVVVEAVISRTGAIEDLHVVSGPPMLRQVAVDAIQAARYRPYRLNGEPVEVQTTITVNFRTEF